MKNWITAKSWQLALACATIGAGAGFTPNAQAQCLTDTTCVIQNSATPVTYSGTVTGNTNLLFSVTNGSSFGQANLTRSQTSTGSLFINNGILGIASGQSLNFSSVNVGTSGNGGPAQSTAARLDLMSNYQLGGQNATVALTLTRGNGQNGTVLLGALNGAGVNLDIGSLSGNGAVLVGAGGRLRVGFGNGDSNFSGLINASGLNFGQGTVEKVGNGRLTLTAVNGYGSTVVSGGVLALSGSGTTVTGSLGQGSISLNGGTLDIDATNLNGATRTTQLSTFLAGRSLNLTSAGGGFEAVTGHTIQIDQTLTNSGAQSNGNLSVSGNGIVNINAAQNYKGTTTVSSGILRLSNAGTIGTGGLALAGGTFDLNGLTRTIGALSSSGGNASLNNGALTFGDAASTNFSGNIIGGGSLTKQGAGTFILNGTSDSARIAVTGGTFATGAANRFTNVGSSGTGAIVSVDGGGILALGGDEGNAATHVHTVTLGNATSIGMIGGAGHTFYADQFVLHGGTVTANIEGATLTSDGIVAVSGTSQSNGGTLNVTGGRLALLGQNGATIVSITNGGYLDLTSGNNLLSALAAVTVDGVNGIAHSTLDIGGTSQRFGTLTLSNGGVLLNNGGQGHATFASSNLLSGIITADTGLTTFTKNFDSQNRDRNGSTTPGIAGGEVEVTAAQASVTQADANGGTLVLDTAGGTFTSGHTDLNIGTQDHDAIVRLGANENLGTGTLTLGGATNAGTLTGNATLTANTYHLNNGSVDANLGAGSVRVGDESAGACGNVALNGTSSAGNIDVLCGTLSTSGNHRFTNANLGLNVNGTLSLGGDEAVDTLTGTTGLIDLGTHGLTVHGGEYGGVIAGVGGSLTKDGTGTLVLSSANTYTGGTTVTSGILRLGNGGSFASTGAITVGGGTLDLNGHDQQAGAVTVTSGDISAGGTLRGTSYSLTNDADDPLASIINANLADHDASTATALTAGGSGVNALTGFNTYSGGTTVTDRGLLIGFVFADDPDGTRHSALGTGAVTVEGGSVLWIARNADSLNGDNATLDQAITGEGDIWKFGLGKLTLANAHNDVGGEFDVFAGTLAITGNGTIGANAAVALGNQDINLNGTIDSYVGSLDISGISASALTIGSLESFQFSDDLTAESRTSVTLGDKELLIGGNNSGTTFAGIIRGTSGGTLTKQGTGTFTFAGDGTGLAHLNVTDGTFLAGNETLFYNSSANDAAIAIAVTGSVGHNAIFDIDSTDQFIGSLTSGTGADSDNSQVQLGRDGSLVIEHAIGTFAGSIVDSEGLGYIEVDGGTQILSGANDYGSAYDSSDRAQWTTGVFGATLRANNDRALGSGSLFLSNGTLGLGLDDGGASQNITLANNVFLNGARDTIDVAAGDTGALAGIVRDYSQPSALVKTGMGALVLRGENSFSGGIDLQAGRIAFTTSGASSSGDISADRGTTIQLGQTDTVADNVVQANAYHLTDQGTGTHSFLVDSLDRGELDGTIDDINNGASSGESLTKTGAGTLVLVGDNSYTGGTTINDGTLVATSAAARQGLYATSTALGTGLVQLQGGVLQLGDGSTVAESLRLSNDIDLGTAAPQTIAVNGADFGELNGTISGSAGLTKVGSGYLRLDGQEAFTGGLAIDGGGIYLTNLDFGTTSGAFAANDITLGNASFLAFDANTTGTYRGNISGNGIVYATGNTDIALTGVNTFGASAASLGLAGNERFGTTILTDARVTVTNDNQLGAADAVLDLSTNFADQSVREATLRAGADLTVNRDILLGYIYAPGGNQYGVGGGSIDTNGHTVTINGLIADEQQADSAFTGSRGNLFVDDTSTDRIGRLILTHANTYTGDTVVRGGVLALQGEGTLGGPTSNVLLQGGQIDFDASVQATEQPAVALSTYLGLRRLIFSSGGFEVANNHILDLDRTLSSSNQGGVPSGPFVKSGGGTLLVTAEQTSTGGINIKGGTLQLSGTGTTGADTGAVAIDNGTFDLNGLTRTIGALSAQNTGALALGGGSLTFGDGKDTEFDGTVTGGGTLQKRGSGTFALGGNHNVSGLTALHITNGTVRSVGGDNNFADANSSNDSSVTLDVTGSSLGGQEATFDLNGTLQTIGALTGGRDGAGGADSQVQLGRGGVLDIRHANGEFAGIISDSNGFGRLGIVGGTQILSGANTYGSSWGRNNPFTSATGISGQGTLRVNNDRALGLGSVLLGGTLGLGLDDQGITQNITLDNNVTISGGGTVDVAANDTGTLTGTIRNLNAPSTLTKTGTGKLVLSGTNTYSRVTDIEGGTLIALSEQALGTGDVDNNSALQIGDRAHGTQHVTIGGNYYSAGDTGTLGFVIGSTNASNSHLTVNGTLDLGATATANLLLSDATLTNYTVGNSYDILNWGALNAANCTDAASCAGGAVNNPFANLRVLDSNDNVIRSLVFAQNVSGNDLSLTLAVNRSLGVSNLSDFTHDGGNDTAANGGGAYELGFLGTDLGAGAGTVADYRRLIGETTAGDVVQPGHPVDVTSNANWTIGRRGGGIDVQSADATLTLSGTISDNAADCSGTLPACGSLTFNSLVGGNELNGDANASAGKIIVTGKNTYGDGTIISGGTVVATDVEAQNGNPVAVTALGSGQVQLRGGVLQIGDGDNRISETLQLDNDLDLGTRSQSVAVEGFDLVNLTGALTGTGGLAKQGSGILLVGGDAQLTGGLTVNGGGLFLSGLDLDTQRDFAGNAVSLSADSIFGFFRTNGAYSGAIGGRGYVGIGDSNVTLSGINTQAGRGTIFGASGGELFGTIIFTGGHVGVASDAALGAAGAVLDLSSSADLTDPSNADFATIQAQDNLTIDREIYLGADGGNGQIGGGAIDANGHSVSLNQSVVDESFADPGLAGSTGRLIIEDTSAAGGGSVILNAVGNYTDGTDILSGTLSETVTGATGTGDIRIARGATLDLGGGTRRLVTENNDIVLTNLGHDTAEEEFAQRIYIHAGDTGKIAGRVLEANAGEHLLLDGQSGGRLALDGTIGVSNVTITNGVTVETNGDNHFVAPATNKTAIEVGGIATLSLGGSEDSGGIGNFTLGNSAGGGTVISTGTINGNRFIALRADTYDLREGTIGTVADQINLTGGAISKSGAGTVTVYGRTVGDIDVSGGRLILQNRSRAQNITISSGSVLQILGNDLLNHSSVVGIDGTGSQLDIGTYDETISLLTLTNGGIVRTTGGRLTILGNQTFLDGRIDVDLASAGDLVKGNDGSATGGMVTLNGTTASRNIIVNGGTLATGSARRFTGQNPAVTINGGTLALGGSETIASLSTRAQTTLDLGTNTLTFGDANNTRFDGGQIGRGLLVKRGSGTWTLGGTLQADLSVTGGTTRLGAAERLDDRSALVIDGGTLDTGNYHDTVASVSLRHGGRLTGFWGGLVAGTYDLQDGTVDGNIGRGTLTKSTAGTVALFGHSLAQVVDVDGGLLRLLGDDRLAANAAVTVRNGASLGTATFTNHVGSFTLEDGLVLGGGTVVAPHYELENGTIYGNLGLGAVTKSTAGTVTLFGQALANQLDITGGSLVLGASDRLSRTAAVNVSGGSLAIGATVQDIGVLTLGAGGTLAVDVTPNANGRVNARVIGLNNGTLALRPSVAGYVVGQSYTLLSASDVLVNNGFQLANSGSAFVTFAPAQVGNTVTAQVALVNGAEVTRLEEAAAAAAAAGNAAAAQAAAAAAEEASPYVKVGGNRLQRGVGHYLARGSGSPARTDLSQVVATINTLDAGAARAAYDSIGGASHAGLGTLQARAEGAFQDLLSSRLSLLDPAGRGRGVLRGTALALSGQDFGPGEVQAGGWSKSYGLSEGLGATQRGTISGFEAALSNHTLFGVAMGQSEGSSAQDGISRNLDGLTAALYGKYRSDRGFYVQGALSYGRDNVRSQRRVAFGTLERQANGSLSQESLAGNLEVGRSFALFEDTDREGDRRLDVTLTPHLGVDLAQHFEATLREHGADSLNLNVTQGSRLESHAGGGLSLSLDWHGQGFGLRPYLDVSYLADIGGTRERLSARLGESALDLASQDLPGAQGTLRAGFTLDLDETVLGMKPSLYLDYNGLATSQETRHAVTSGIGFTW